MTEDMRAQVTKYQPTYDKPGVCFDPEEAVLEGVYTDELSAHRAKKGWAKALENTFLLTQGYDFVASIQPFSEQKRFVLKCEFSTACGRYAFWRLTHAQAPDAQYLIETAHIPRNTGNDSKRKDADIVDREASPSILDESFFPNRFGNNRTMVSDIIERVGKTVRHSAKHFLGRNNEK
jgi:hypothetical protein